MVLPDKLIILGVGAAFVIDTKDSAIANPVVTRATATLLRGTLRLVINSPLNTNGARATQFLLQAPPLISFAFTYLSGIKPLVKYRFLATCDVHHWSHIKDKKTLLWLRVRLKIRDSRRE